MKDLQPEACKRACGVYPQIFEKMLHVLREHVPRKIKPGRPAKLSLADQLLMTLQYWREYRTYCHIGLSWGVHESVVCRTVQRMENLRLKSKEFHVPGKKQLQKSATPWEVIVVDVAESPGERLQKKQRCYYSGKKKRPTQNAQCVVAQKTRDILCVAFGKGREHDCTLCKRSQVIIAAEIEC